MSDNLGAADIVVNAFPPRSTDFRPKMTSVSAPRFLDRLKSAASAAGFGDDWVALAKKAGVSDRTLRRWREGKNDDPRLSTMESVAGALGIGVGQLLGEPSRQSAVESDLTVGFPLVAEGIAAGFGAIPQAPDERTDYHFRKEWKGIRGWGADPERFVLFRLREDADSMVPEILPGSLILADRSEAGRLDLKPNGYYLVVTNPPSHVAVKRVLPIREGQKITRLVFLSANPTYPPREVAVKRIQDLVRARVVWWGTVVD